VSRLTHHGDWDLDADMFLRRRRLSPSQWSWRFRHAYGGGQPRTRRVGRRASGAAAARGVGGEAGPVAGSFAGDDGTDRGGVARRRRWGSDCCVHGPSRGWPSVRSSGTWSRWPLAALPLSHW